MTLLLNTDVEWLIQLPSGGGKEGCVFLNVYLKALDVHYTEAYSFRTEIILSVKPFVEAKGAFSWSLLE